ncbi:hypothetical protein [Flavobacterium sp. ZB4R12]|uniref:hypothetical protein n=1 Tax=Flavobacterium sp. ZB4R12 TaxID=3398732 RepID=UPI003AB03DA6
MVNHIVRLNGEFYGNRFNEEINKVKTIITQREELSEDAFNKIRHTTNINYIINGLNYEGGLISYQISKNNLIIGRLDCFVDIEYKFIEISLIPNY